MALPQISSHDQARLALITCPRAAGSSRYTHQTELLAPPLHLLAPHPVFMLVSLPDKYCVSLTGIWELFRSFRVKLAGNVTPILEVSSLTFDPHTSDAPLSSLVQKISDKRGNKGFIKVHHYHQKNCCYANVGSVPRDNMTGLALELVPHLP